MEVLKASLFIYLLIYLFFLLDEEIEKVTQAITPLRNELNISRQQSQVKKDQYAKQIRVVSSILQLNIPVYLKDQVRCIGPQPLI